MPYVVEEARETGRAAVADLIRKNKMFYGEPNEVIYERAHKAQIIGSSFSDPGEDWTRMEILDADGKVIWSTTAAGY